MSFELFMFFFCQKQAPFFKMYSIYVKNFNSALSAIDVQLRDNPTFSAFLRVNFGKLIILLCILFVIYRVFFLLIIIGYYQDRTM
jgi:hypothetical protein